MYLKNKFEYVEKVLFYCYFHSTHVQSECISDSDSDFYFLFYFFLVFWSVKSTSHWNKITQGKSPYDLCLLLSLSLCIPKGRPCSRLFAHLRVTSSLRLDAEPQLILMLSMRLTGKQKQKNKNKKKAADGRFASSCQSQQRPLGGSSITQQLSVFARQSLSLSLLLPKCI